MTDDSLQPLRDLADAHNPSSDARLRMAVELDRHIAAASPRTHSLRMWRAPRIALGATLAAATVIAVAYTLSPSNSTSDQHHFTGPDTAAAHALVNAGEAAADAKWTPLGNDGYFHVYSTSFQLKGPDQVMLDNGPSTSEVWMRRDGTGQSIGVSGGEYPQRYEHAGYRPDGTIMNVGGSTLPKGPRVSDARALADPDDVFFISWPASSADGVQHEWIRQPKNYLLTFTGPFTETPRHGDTVADVRARENWGLTVKQLNTIPATSGSRLDHAIGKLLASSKEGSYGRGPVTTGAFGLTQTAMDREDQIQSATTLLGHAPLAPNARRSIFRWLAQQPGATIKQHVKDRIGRAGERITFSSNYNEISKGRIATVQDVLDAAAAAGTRGIKPTTVVRLLDMSTKPVRKSLDRTATINLPAHREQRTWYVELIVDPDTGALLQYSTFAHSKSTGSVPELYWHPHGGLELMVQGGGSMSFGGGGQIYRARESTTTIKPLSPVCVKHPELCRP